MLSKKTSESINKWKVLLLIPILSIFIYSFNTEKIYKIKIDNQTIEPNTFIHPLEGNPIISSQFGERIHPVLKVMKFHTGVDYRVENNTKIIASADGIVISTGNNPNDGNYIYIKNNDQYETRYLHLSKYLVKTHQNIKQGQIIGYTGNSGKSSGPHLHFEILKNKKYIDPKSILNPADDSSLNIFKYFKVKKFSSTGDEEIKIVKIDMTDTSELSTLNNLICIENNNIDIINLSDSNNTMVVFRTDSDEPGVIVKIN